MTEEYPTPSTHLIQKCLTLVETLIAHGDNEQSIEILQALLTADPNHPELHKKKAFALISSNRYQDALKSLDSCIQNSVSMKKSQCLVYKADLLYSLERYTQALKIYQLLLSHNHNREQILYRKGLCLLAQSRLKAASQVFDKVLSLNPSYSQCYIMNSHSFFMQKNYKKALKYLHKVTDGRDFQNIDALYLKACCYYNLEQLESSQKQLKRILEIDYSHYESKILLSIIKSKHSQKSQREHKQLGSN